MKQAIFEILGMLLVAVGIGVFFTYRYWKAKFDGLTKVNEQQKNDLHESNTKVATLEKDLETLKIEHQNHIKEVNDQFEKDKKTWQNKPQDQIEEHILQLDDLKKQLEKEKKNTKKVEKSKKKLEDSLALKDEQLGEKERELAELSKQFTTHNISYYKQIDGKRYKAAILLEADESVAGVGDGRISKADAEKIFATISDGHLYTQVEKDTMHYIRENYNWTPEADELFRKKVRSWAAKGHQLDDSK